MAVKNPDEATPEEQAAQAAADKAAADKAAADKASDTPAMPAPGAQQAAVPVGQPSDFTHDETVVGGKFRVRRGGRVILVNAMGKLINEDGERLTPDGTVMSDREVLMERYDQDAVFQESLMALEASN